MKRPTDFIPVHDQTPEQAADMVEKLFVENERLEARLDKAGEVWPTLRTCLGVTVITEHLDEVRACYNAMVAALYPEQANSHNYVIPKMECAKCGKTAADTYRPLTTKYPEGKEV